ncbi:hypothetical protein CCH79_00009581 [Gambusia affinis]|uniref:Uncharacterized protein n=1 Tax=Gambusia affinis TaxID=33528 RepID=A0A315VEC5_GAMAF|nr:hypothetical protein CCH79_00009581 [Gambusia affinis]
MGFCVQELQLILQTVRSDLQAREEQLSEGEQERRREREERERSVAELRAGLQLKEQLLQVRGQTAAAERSRSRPVTLRTNCDPFAEHEGSSSELQQPERNIL